MGTNEYKYYTVMKKYFLLGELEQPRQNENLLWRHDKPDVHQGRTPFICTLWVPIHLSFNSQQGPPLSSLSGYLSQNVKLSAQSLNLSSPCVSGRYLPILADGKREGGAGSKSDLEPCVWLSLHPASTANLWMLGEHSTLDSFYIQIIFFQDDIFAI